MDYTGAGKCTVDGEDNKEVKTREEADMTINPVFQNFQKWSKSVLKWSKSIFQVFLTVTYLLDHFWTAFDTFGKTRLRVLSASSLVLSSLLSLPTTVHLPATV